MLNKGRCRRRTLDRQYQGKMREALKERLDEMSAHLTRDEVESLGADIGLAPVEATRLFDRLKGVSWRGEYVGSNGEGWTEARITDLN